MTAPQRIVILGGGFGGSYCAQTLERLTRRLGDEVILIDRNNYFIFHPLLVEAGTGSLEPRHAVVPIRAFLRRTTFIMSEVLSVDLASQTVRHRVAETGHEALLSFDHLAIAMGSVTRLPAVPGLREYGFEMKSLADAVGLRDHAIRMLEAANTEPDAIRRRALLRFLVVGANFTGVEVAGEFDMFLHQARRYYRNIEIQDIKITLVELGDRILTALDDSLSEFAARHLQRRGVELIHGTTVQRVEVDHAVLADGRRIDTRTVIWCAGIEPAPTISKLGLPTDQRGYIVCERDLRVKGCENVWAIGDCAVNTDSQGKPYPATAQHAVRQGVHLAKNIANVRRGTPPTPCDIRSQGALAALGCRTGVAKVFGVKLAGFPAWFLWRTVYLLKMPTWSRRIRIALDWTLDLFFHRDIVQLGVHRRAAPRKNESGELRSEESFATRPVQATTGSVPTAAVPQRGVEVRG